MSYPKLQNMSKTCFVRIENDGLGFYFILFYFTFIFSYLVENKMKKTKCDGVTGHIIWSLKSHDHMIQRNM